VLKIIS